MKNGVGTASTFAAIFLSLFHFFMTRLLPAGIFLLTTTAACAQQLDTPATLAPDSLRTDVLPSHIISFRDDCKTVEIGLPPFTTIQPALSRVAGVQYTPYSGAPGAGAVVRIRGVASLDSNVQPLYVVDGVPVFQYRFGSTDRFAPFASAPVNPDASTNPLLSIAPEDIEQIEVLKGAFETGQYGFLGQNGVVRITTRRGKAGQPLRVQYTGLGGVQTARTRYTLLGAREAAELANEAARNNNYPDEYAPAQLASFGAGTNWQDEVLRTAAIQEHHLSLSGGTAHGTRYYAALNYLNQQGIVLNTGLQRYGLRLNLDQNVGQRLRLSGSLSYSQVQERRPDPILFRNTLRFMPTISVYEANGDYATEYGNPNPVQIAQQNVSTPRNRRLLAHAELRYEIATGLTLDLRAALERDSLTARDYRGPDNYYTPRDGFETDVRSAFHQQIILNPALRYARILATRHALTASAEATSWRNRQSQAFNEYSVPAPPFNLPRGGSNGSRATQTYTLLGYQLMASYTYAGRYALQGSLRADNSSQIPKTERRHWLPAAQATWHAAQENWLKDHSSIGILDVWAGWGRTSNRANFSGDHGFVYQTPNYSFFQFLDELTTQADAGLRLEIAPGHLSFTASTYQRDTRANLGQFGRQDPAYVRNRGVELMVGSSWQAGRLNGHTALAAAFNRNRYERPADTAVPNYLPGRNFVLTPDQPLASFYGFRYLGVDGAGNPRFDQTGGGTFPGVLGSGLPRQLLSFTQQLAYGRFDLQMQLDGLFGYEVFDPNLSLLDVPAGGFNATTRIRDRWTPTHQSTEVPRAGASLGGFYGGVSNYTLQSGNHVRLSSVVLTAEVWHREAHRVAVFLSGTNLLVLSAYRGYDPNVSSAEADARQAGLDLATYPTARTVALGVRASF